MQKDAEAAHLREQAARCRRLADAILNKVDAATLRKTAEDFEARAAAAEARDGAAMNGVPNPLIRPAED